MINKITIKKSARIIDNSYVIKKNNKSLRDTYNYLLSRSFDYFPEVLKEDDKYIYSRYIEDLNEPKEQKITDLATLVSLLHSKTTFYKEIDLDYYKYIYESVNSNIDDTYNYYNTLMDNIDEDIYMSPSEYLIARNISMVYSSLAYAKKHINEWYKMIENKRRMRVVTIHNNLSLDHYLKADKPYLISWDKSVKDMPIYDLISLYKNNYLDFDFTNVLKYYLNKYPLSPEEMTLFLTLISIPDKVVKGSNEYKTVKNTSKIINYIYKTREILKEYSIEKQTNKS